MKQRRLHEKIIYRIETNDTISNILINKKRLKMTKLKLKNKNDTFLITIGLYFIRIKLH